MFGFIFMGDRTSTATESNDIRLQVIRQTQLPNVRIYFIGSKTKTVTKCTGVIFTGNVTSAAIKCVYLVP